MLRLTAQGRLIEANSAGGATGRHCPPLRSAITEFSRAARRRLLKFFARLNPRFKGRKTFVTLTFAGKPSGSEAKAALKRFLMRMRRAHQKACAIWRLELQERGSIHFHLIWFDLPFIPQSELQDIWTACTGEDRSIVDIRLIRSMKGVMSYCSKYIAKLPASQTPASLDCVSYQHDQETDGIGRWWGCHIRDALPLAEELRGYILNEDLEKLWRAILQEKSGGKAGEWSAAGFLFTDHALELFEWLMRKGGWFASEYENLLLNGVKPRESCLI